MSRISRGVIWSRWGFCFLIVVCFFQSMLFVSWGCRFSPLFSADSTGSPGSAPAPQGERLLEAVGKGGTVAMTSSITTTTTRRKARPATSTMSSTLRPKKQHKVKPVETQETSDSTGSLPRLTPDSSLSSVPRERLRLFGNPVPSTVKLVAGIGSVKRKKVYLLQTLKGLFRDSSPEVAAVVHLSDFDMTWVESISSKIQAEYQELINAGQLHVIHAPEETYPPLDICPPDCTYNDSSKRVMWRSKQNVDYAWLMYYAAPFTDYYMQLEDDLEFESDWVGKVLWYVKETYPPSWRNSDNVPWRVINFAELGFIGRLFHTRDLLRFAQYLLLFYDQKPCDMLMHTFPPLMAQIEAINYFQDHGSLFQHVGFLRTFAGGGFQMLQESTFDGKPWFNNPPAEIVSTFTAVPTFDSRFLYFPGGEPKTREDQCNHDLSTITTEQGDRRCFFWAEGVKALQHVTAVFQKPLVIKAVLFEFGHTKHPKDVPAMADFLVAGPSGIEDVGENHMLDRCGDFVNFTNTAVGENAMYWESTEERHMPIPAVQCVRMMVLEDQSDWMLMLRLLVRGEDVPQESTSSDSSPDLPSPAKS